ILYLFILFLGMFIIVGYFMIVFHSVECYVLMILISDAFLLYFYDFLKNNSYKLFFIPFNFELFLGIWVLFIVIGMIFPELFIA
ncbi:hypothetical protein, partial [Methanobrevibacter sp.]